jgi:hypothetical protein
VCVSERNLIDESTQPSAGIRCNGKSEWKAVIRDESRRRKGSIMPSSILFGISVVAGLAAWGAVAWHYIWPTVSARSSPENLKPILLLHAFRFLGLAFVVQGVVSPELPAAFGQPVAYGDFITAMLALLALTTLGTRTGTVVTWVFNIFGTADLLFAFYLGSGISLPDRPGLLGAAYFILTAYVPLLLITHGLVFRLLMRRGEQHLGQEGGEVRHATLGPARRI